MDFKIKHKMKQKRLYIDTFVMLEELLEQDQFELLPSKECDTERRLVYLMNDAVESFLVFRGAALTGHYLEDYEGALTWSISRDATRYVLVVRQGDILAIVE